MNKRPYEMAIRPRSRTVFMRWYIAAIAAMAVSAILCGIFDQALAGAFMAGSAVGVWINQ